MLRNSNQQRLATDDADPAVVEGLGPPIALFKAFARRPERARAIQGWGSYYLSRKCALTLRHRELVIDRTTALCGAEYEWDIHIGVFATKARLTDAQVRSLAGGASGDECWTDPADRAVIAAVDALHARNDLTDDEWTALVDAVGEDGTVDLMLVCGWYHAISYVARVGRFAPEAFTG